MNDENKKEPEWVARVKTVYALYLSELQKDAGFTLEQLSKLTNRSKGRLSEDIMLCKFMRTHPKVETYENIRDAVEFCKKLKRIQKVQV